MKVSKQGGSKNGLRLESMYEVLVSHEAEKYKERQEAWKDICLNES